MPTVNANLSKLLKNFDYSEGEPLWPFGILQPEVNLYCRMLVRCGVDPVYHEFMREHPIFGQAGHNFEVACAQEKVVPFHDIDELKAVAWLVQNRSVLKLGEREKAVLLNSPRFYLVDFKTEQHGRLRWMASPVWRVRSKTGHGQFDYCPWNWQSGRKPQIVV